VTKVIAPGGRLGVLGSGQLGRMFALAARRLGYRVVVYSPDQDSPTGQVADTEFTARYDDLERVKAFARTVDVVTFEFENVPFATAAACAQFAPVRPRGEVLHITQQRLREKTYLREQGFPVTPFARVTSLAELEAALDALGLPAVLKSADFGYDGKGQRKLLARADAPAAWSALGVQEAILEGFVDFALEVSVVAARGLDGSFAAFDVFENAHAHHILDVTVCPARIDPKLAREALELARGILERLDVVGVLCVEMFVTKSGTLLVNELAPRPHNSGHLTFDASLTNQFEQQVRAVCGLPLGSPQLLRPAAMMNLLGDVWSNGEPNWAKALELPNVKLHLYGKSDPRPGRKMGHLTALADTVDEAERVVREARARLCL
jgi:5-(carboxyamino)imidazole ribonucleotide synthase